MARGGRIQLNMDHRRFQQRLDLSIRRVERGTRKATVTACEELKQMTLDEVPEKSGTLRKSFYYEILGYRRNFEAILGYGGNGDPVNPRTGQRASEYMLIVHEDLDAHHDKGKAKYLEDPLREYRSRFVSTIAKDIREALN